MGKTTQGEHAVSNGEAQGGVGGSGRKEGQEFRLSS